MLGDQTFFHGSAGVLIDINMLIATEGFVGITRHGIGTTQPALDHLIQRLLTHHHYHYHHYQVQTMVSYYYM